MKPKENDVETRLDFVDYKQVVFQYLYKQTFFCNKKNVHSKHLIQPAQFHYGNEKV